MKRSIIAITALITLVVFGSIFLSINYLVPRDGTPDDRLLASMEQISFGAQTVLDETGNLPTSSIELINLLWNPVPNAEKIDVSYQRLGPSDIKLCGDFRKRSQGQTRAHPFNDVNLQLRSELTAPRPKSGLHCYDIKLSATANDTRLDALLYRELDDAITAVECSFSATGNLPNSLAEAQTLRVQERDDPACRVKDFLGQSNQTLKYSVIDQSTIKLCTEFRQSYIPTPNRVAFFDQSRDARFLELSQERSEPGKFCYSIKMFLPDPSAEPTFVWDEPLDVDSYSDEKRTAAIKDKRTIRGIVNVLRLARCAFSMNGNAPKSVDDAVRTIEQSPPEVARRSNCGWAPSYYSASYNYPVATYEVVEENKVRVCAEFDSGWEYPLALGFYGNAQKTWPTSLAELQRPIAEPGDHCFDVILTKIGSGTIR